MAAVIQPDAWNIIASGAGDGVLSLINGHRLSTTPNQIQAFLSTASVTLQIHGGTRWGVLVIAGHAQGALNSFTGSGSVARCDGFRRPRYRRHHLWCETRVVWWGWQVALSPSAHRLAGRFLRYTPWCVWWLRLHPNAVVFRASANQISPRPNDLWGWITSLPVGLLPGKAFLACAAMVQASRCRSIFQMAFFRMRQAFLMIKSKSPRTFMEIDTGLRSMVSTFCPLPERVSIFDLQTPHGAPDDCQYHKSPNFPMGRASVRWSTWPVGEEAIVATQSGCPVPAMVLING